MPAVPELAAESFPQPVRQKARSLIDGVAQSPTDPWANGDLAMLLHAHERLPAARDLYRRAAALSGGEFRWTYLLGIAQHQSGQHARAASSFRTALDIRPYGPAGIRLGEALAAGGQLEAAEDALRAASNIDGNAAYVYYALGKVLLERGETAEAIELLERAVALAPDSGAVRRSLGLAYRSTGEQELAQRSLAQIGAAADQQPMLEDALYESVVGLAVDALHFLNRGRSLDSAGQTAEAIDAYQKAIELDPSMAQAHANLVGSFGRTGEIDRAEEHYATALALNPNLPELHNNWGVVQASRGDPAAAVAAFHRALELNPNSEHANANLGVALLEAGQLDEATRRFQEAVKSDPTNRPARMNLGTLALEGGRPTEAVEHLEAALRGDEDGSEPFVRYALGHAYQRIGRLAEARRSFEQALQVAEIRGPDDLAAQIRADIEALAQ